MKRTLIIISLLAILLSASCPLPDRLVRLTVINKSGYALEIALSGAQYEQLYYLRVAKGDREYPVEQVFTITPDIYTYLPYYVEIWDPVYGTECGATTGGVLQATGNVKITFLACGENPRPSREPRIYKYPVGVFRFRF